MTEKRNLKVISDPGHGWLSVRLQDIVALNIQEKISSHSYMTTSRVYLEEDLDMRLFLNAAKAAGWELNIVDSHVDKTPIRSYAPYTSSKLDLALNLKQGTEFLMFQNGSWSMKSKVTAMDTKKIQVHSEAGNNFIISKTQFLNYIKPLETLEPSSSGSKIFSPKL